MSQSNPIPLYLKNAILACDDSESMQRAIAENRFYVELLPLLGGGYSIGSMTDELPHLASTRSEILTEIEDMKATYLQEIEEGERDEDDEWEGELGIARFNPDDITKLDLLDEQGLVYHTESIVSLCGF